MTTQTASSFIKKTLTGLILSASCLASTANAALIPIEDWHDTNGPVGGLLQATFDSSIYFAQAKDIDFSINDTYEMLDGYHLATAAEYKTLWDNNVAANGTPTTVLLHYGRGGWDGYINNSGARGVYFAFADMFDPNLPNAAGHVGSSEVMGTYTSIISAVAASLEVRPDLFAGLVLIKDEANTTSTSVPEPSTLAVLALGVLGFAARQLKKK